MARTSSKSSTKRMETGSGYRMKGIKKRSAYATKKWVAKGRPEVPAPIKGR